MLILNPKIQQLMKDQFCYDEEQIQSMVMEYQMGILTLLIYETELFIEKNNLSEIENSLDKKLALIKDKVKGELKDHMELYTEFFSTITKYPELQNNIEDQITSFNNTLNKDIVQAMDDEGKMKLLEIIESDVIEIKKNEKILNEIA